MSNAIDFNRDELIKLNKEYQRLANYGNEEFEAMQFVHMCREGKTKPLKFFKTQVSNEMRKIKTKMKQYANPLTSQV